MSTRSVVAEPVDGGFRGRYVHSDGYPTAMVPTLLEMIRREGMVKAAIQVVETGRRHEPHMQVSPLGVEVVRRTIIDKGPQGWSYLDRNAVHERDENRYIVVNGYGHAFNDAEPWEITQADEPEDIEWAYVLYDTHISVFQGMGNRWQYIAVVKYDVPISHDELVTIECGEDFSRCKHYAWAHDESVPKESRMSMRTWLGLRPRDYQDIEAVFYGGTWYELGGSGSSGSASSSDWRMTINNPPKVHYWWASVKGLQGDVRMGRCLKGNRIKLDRPVRLRATKVAEAEEIRTGTVLTR